MAQPGWVWLEKGWLESSEALYMPVADDDPGAHEVDRTAMAAESPGAAEEAVWSHRRSLRSERTLASTAPKSCRGGVALWLLWRNASQVASTRLRAGAHGLRANELP